MRKKLSKDLLSQYGKTSLKFLSTLSEKFIAHFQKMKCRITFGPRNKIAATDSSIAVGPWPLKGKGLVVLVSPN